MELVNLNGLYLKSHTQKIQDCFKNVLQNFFDVGFYLWEIEHYSYYKEDGFNTFSEYYTSVLGFKKSTVYSLISVCKKFSVSKYGLPTFRLSSEFENFSYTQLCEMVSIKNPKLLSSITPEMSTRDIRAAKKEFKDFSQKVQSPGKIDNIIDVDFKEEVEIEKFQVQDEKVQLPGKSDVIQVPLSLVKSLCSSVLADLDMWENQAYVEHNWQDVNSILRKMTVLKLDLEALSEFF